MRKILKTRLGITSISNGYAVTGLQTINGKQYYFDNEGRQVKGHFVTINNQRYFLDGDSGEIARSRFVTENNKWYYVDGNGKLVKGAQVINGNHYYFNNDYSQVKVPGPTAVTMMVIQVRP